MSEESKAIVAMYEAGNDEFKRFVVRVLTIYQSGSAAAKQIIDEAADAAKAGTATYNQFTEALERAEQIA